MKLQRSFVLLVLISVIIGIAVITRLAREPRYHGRTLTSWLRQCSDTPLNETQRLQEAQDAIRAIGATKGLPKILRFVEATDDPVSLWLIDKTQKYRVRFLRWKAGRNHSYEDWEKFQWHSAADFQQLGIAGFEVLGTNAGPAAADLERLLDKPDHAFTAQRCLVLVGKPAEFIFCRALTNQDSRIRQWSVDNLAHVTDDVVVFIDRIKPRLEDSSEAVRIASLVGNICSAAAFPIFLIVYKHLFPH